MPIKKKINVLFLQNLILLEKKKNLTKCDYQICLPSMLYCFCFEVTIQLGQC